MREPSRILTKTNDSEALGISAIEGRAMWRVKSWQPQSQKSQSIALAGESLPAEVGQTSMQSMLTLCVGPGDWLLVADKEGADESSSQWRTELQAQGAALVDVSDGLAIFEVRGSAARELLSKGCGIDLHAEQFRAPRCARTRFAQIPVVVVAVDHSPRFELYVARSFAQYLNSWLADAAIEFDGADSSQ